MKVVLQYIVCAMFSYVKKNKNRCNVVGDSDPVVSMFASFLQSWGLHYNLRCVCVCLCRVHVHVLLVHWGFPTLVQRHAL